MQLAGTHVGLLQNVCRCCCNMNIHLERWTPFAQSTDTPPPGCGSRVNPHAATSPALKLTELLLPLALLSPPPCVLPLCHPTPPDFTFICVWPCLPIRMDFLSGGDGKEPTCQCKRHRDVGWIPGSGRSPGGGRGNPLQYPCLENPMDRGAWWAIVHRIAKNWTGMKRLSTHGPHQNTSS